MSTDTPLGRAPSPDDLRAIAWLDRLEDADRASAQAALRVADIEAGRVLVRVGRPVTFWFGVIDGLLKVSSDLPNGNQSTLLGVPGGGWFGEGTVLKREEYRFSIVALRKSRVAGLPSEAFHALLDRSLAFNRFVLEQLNERLAQFIANREADRLGQPDVHVAQTLVSLFNPVLYPGTSSLLRITQHELAYLVGLSRQRVNQALRHLQDQGLVHTEYGGLRVPDRDRLRGFVLAWQRGRS